MSNADCIFCKIVHGELPSTKAHEDDIVLAFEDIAPIAPTHTLIIPKQHIGRLQGDEDEATLGHMVTTAAKIARTKGLTEGGYRLAINQGDDAGQLVEHVHLHLLGGEQLGPPAAVAGRDGQPEG